MNPLHIIKLPPSLKRVHTDATLIGTAVFGAVAASAALWLSWHDLPGLPRPPEPLAMHVGYWVRGALAHLSGGHFGGKSWAVYQAYLEQMREAGQYHLLSMRFWFSGIAGLATAGYSYIKLSEPQDHLIPIRGRRYFKGDEAIRLANEESRREIAVSGMGIRFHPRIPISLDRETRHTLIMGGVGSGKTQVIWHLIDQTTGRGDRAIIYDNKGEFTESIDTDGLIAPWDSRSMVWDIAADCRNKQDARELSARLIPSNDKDPMWSNASRAILTGLIVYLQAMKGSAWGFRDLADLLPTSIANIQAIMQQYNPEGLRSVQVASNTTTSILINLDAFMQVIYDLADAWGDAPAGKRISIRQWLDGKTDTQVLILQGSGSYSLLTRAYVNAIISMMSAHVASPDFGNDRKRRIWMFLDELPQLGRVEHLAPLMEIGRSKGIRVVIGVQSVSQINDIYGQDAANAWTSMIGTSVYGRMSGGISAEWISSRVGDREDERPNETWTYYSGPEPTMSRSYVREIKPVILPAQLQSDLGAGKTGVRVLLDGFPDGIYLVEYPYADKQQKRPASLPAKWVQGPVIRQATSTPMAISNQAGVQGGIGLEATATAVPPEVDGFTSSRKRLIKRDSQTPEQAMDDPS